MSKVVAILFLFAGVILFGFCFYYISLFNANYLNPFIGGKGFKIVAILGVGGLVSLIIAFIALRKLK